MFSLVFFNNSLNHHQVLLADELYRLLGDAFYFVTVCPDESSSMKGGENYSNRDYCLKASDSLANYQKALRMARTADVCVFGAESMLYSKERARSNPRGLSFEVGERWLKKGWINIFSPRFLKWWIAYIFYFRKANFFKLCSGAFVASDHFKLHSYKGRCFKWGYFSNVERGLSLPKVENDSTKKTVSLMWCARFIGWKHPELVIELAQKLKNRGYDVQIDMFGAGKELEPIIDLCNNLNVQSIVHFKGAVHNDGIVCAMREHDIFLATSDRNEGWGVVVSEAMSNQCAVVGSDEMGSVPYLIRDGENGMVFKSRSIESLFEKVSYLIDHPDRMKQIAGNGYLEMVNVWSPVVAATNFIQLIDDIQSGKQSSIKVGPASIAD